MKKLLAILLAMMLVLVSVTALAAGDNPDDPDNPPATEETGDDTGNDAGDSNPLSTYLPTEDQKPSIDPAAATYTIDKAINIRDKFADAVVPADAKFAFDVTNGTTTATNSDGSTIDMTDLVPEITNAAIANGDTSITLTLTMPDPFYPVPGIYEYDIEEKSSDYAGMTYAEDLKLKITVIWNKDLNEGAGGLEVAGIAIRQSGVKVTEIENEYAAGNLKVTKTVSGNFCDVNKKFPITISFTADRNVNSVSTYQINGTGTETNITWSGKTATVEVELANGDYVEIKNLPEGVTYTVKEGITEANRLEDSKDQPENPEAYKVAGEVETAKDIVASTTTPEEITNTKDIEPDTGIALDSLPYMLLMVLAAAGFMMKARKREEY